MLFLSVLLEVLAVEHEFYNIIKKNMGFTNIPSVYVLLLHRGKGKQKSEIGHLRQKKARMREILILKALRILMKKMMQHQKKKVTMKRLKLKMRKTKQKMKSRPIRKAH